MRDEVVGVTPTPGGLGLGASGDLTRRSRTRPLATTDAPVRHKPPTADAARPLDEHPQMLVSSAKTQDGPFLTSHPGSILASAEVQGECPKSVVTLNGGFAISQITFCPIG